MQVTWQMALLVLPMVFLAACVDAIGGGGGLISLPVYQAAGLPYDLASGTNKFSAMFGTLSATVKYGRSGCIKWKQGLLASAAAIPAAWLGATAVSGLNEKVKQVMLLVLLPLMAIVLLSEKSLPAESKPETPARLWGCLAAGLLIGFYDGFFGPGTGTLLILFLVRWAGMDAVSASGTAKLVNLSSNVSALAKWIASGNVLFALAIPAACCGIAGGFIGSKIAMKRGAKAIRIVMLCVLALLIGKMAYGLIVGR